MRSRLESYERRLAALQAVLRGWSGETERIAGQQQQRKLVAEIARAGLRAAGIDPDTATMVRRLDEPEPAPRHVHPLHRLAERQRPRTLLEALDEMTSRYHNGRPPDLRQASVMQLIGYYCFGDGAKGAAREAPA